MQSLPVVRGNFCRPIKTADQGRLVESVPVRGGGRARSIIINKGGSELPARPGKLTKFYSLEGQLSQRTYHSLEIWTVLARDHGCVV
jgi:hypothetical protein